MILRPNDSGLRVVFLPLLLLVGLLLSTASPAAELVLADDGRSAGYLTLAWPEAPGEEFLLEQRSAQGWTTVYSGTDRASSFSGLEDGRYEWRLSGTDGRVLATHSIRVKHHPMQRAWLFFGVGALVFSVLLGLLIADKFRNDGHE